MFRTILIGILILMLLVIIHELGHFWAAKKSGVKVLEFGIGIPPKAKKLFSDKSGTEYTLNLIPLGGFVRLKGDDPENKNDFLANDSIQKVSIWKKMVIMMGGIFMNTITAWLLFSIIFIIGIKPISVIPDNANENDIESYLFPSYSWAHEQGLIEGEQVVEAYTVNEIISDGLAHQSGLTSGSTILSINQIEVNNQNLSTVLQENIGNTIEIKYLDSQQNELTAITTCPEDSCMLGVIHYDSSGIELIGVKMGVFEAMGAGWKEIWVQTKLTFNSLGNIVSGLFNGNAGETASKLTGPVGAIKIGESVFQTSGIVGILAFVGMISLALAIFNLLPIPALDGGRGLGFLIQSIFRIRAEKYAKFEGIINFIFFILLMGLGIFIMIKDLSFWGVNVF